MKNLRAASGKGAVTSIALLFGVTSCDDGAPPPPPPHVQRVSLDTFRAENPDLADADFSGIGALRFNDESTCTAFLIEGDIIVTALHCLESAYIFFALGGTNGVYTFHATGTDGQPVTLRLSDGTLQSLLQNIFFSNQVDIRGRSRDNVYSVVSQRFLEDIQQDVLFFRLSAPAPETLTPLEIATEEEIESLRIIRSLYTIGFSPYHYSHLGREQWITMNADRSPTISRHACSAIVEPTAPNILSNTCFARPGDSGGPLFQITPDNQLKAFGTVNAILWPGDEVLKDFNNLYSTLNVPLYSHYIHFTGYTFSTTLSDLIRPCDNGRGDIERHDPCRLFAPGVP